MKKDIAHHLAEIKTVLVLLGELIDTKKPGGDITEENYEKLCAYYQNLSDEVNLLERKLRRQGNEDDTQS